MGLETIAIGKAKWLRDNFTEEGGTADTRQRAFGGDAGARNLRDMRIIPILPSNRSSS